MILGKYQIAADEDMEYTSYSKTAVIINKEEKRYWAKWLTKIEKNSTESKILLDQLGYQKRVLHSTVPQLIEYGWDDNQAAYCIVFEHKETSPLQEKLKSITPSTFLKGIEKLVTCLQYLHQKHGICHGAISPTAILVDSSFHFYLIDFKLDATKQSSSTTFAAPENFDPILKGQGFPYQADIYSIGKLIAWYFEQKEIDDEEAVQELIAKTCAKEPSKRPNYVALLENLVQLVEHTVFDAQNMVWVRDSSPQILAELNDPNFKPKFNIAPDKGNNILLDIVTKSFRIHCLWLLDKKELLIRNSQRREEDERNYQRIYKYGQVLALPIVYKSNCYPQFNLTPIFRKIQQTKIEERSYQAEKRHITRELRFFKELLKKEKEVLEQNSLRLRYSSFDKKGDHEIHFKLEFNAKYSADSFIRTHIDKATPPNPEDFEFILSQTSNKKEIKNPLSFTGIAYDFDRRQRILKFKDCERLEFDKIPTTGYLLENIRKQEEEKNRQLEAIRKVEHNEVQNRDLIHSLFNPKDLEGRYLGVYDLATVFQKDAEGNSFEYSDNQKRAILNALHRAPLSVIQGPPGTGKTTVITEIVFQILDQNPDAKILITSQTNNAVDNVLENLLARDIPILRLSGIRQPNSILKKHTLERKIEGWKDKTGQKAKSNWKSYAQEFKEKVAAENTLLSSIFDILASTKSWATQKKHLGKTIARFDDLSTLSNSLTTKDAFIAALNEISSLDFVAYFTKHELHKDWLATISALDENSNLNQKLIDSIQVIGATTNHIAAGKYKKYNFEFDYVIMDESGKATLAESLIPLVLAKNAVLVGDHRQLRPMLTANREVENWLRNKYKSEAEGLEWDDYFNRPSLFEQVIEQIDNDFKSQLAECRRCSKDQILLTSKCFYEPYGDEPILAVERPTEKEHNLDLKVDSSIIFLDTGNDYRSDRVQGSSRNRISAKLIPELLKGLDGYEKVKDYSIGVITGYSAQLREIRNTLGRALDYRQLKNIKAQQVAVSVVDKFQGLEKDIVIFDLVKSQDGLGFLANANRINVALSRQKRLLIIVGNLDSILTAEAPKCYQKKEERPALQKYLAALKPAWIVKNIDQLF